jgi:hypothetical protein
LLILIARSGGLYSSSSDMIRFLQHALKTHNTYSSVKSWFQPAAYNPGSHSLMGYPWETLRPTTLLLNSTRPVTLNTKGGGLVGYYSYSIVIPEYDLAIFMIVGGDGAALPALNAVRNAIVGPIVQIAEDVAQEQLASGYAGKYAAASARADPAGSYKPSLNSSLVLAQTSSQNLYITSWISNGTDALGNFMQVAAAQGGTSTDMYFQVIPTFEQRIGDDGSVGEVWRFINVLNDSPGQNAWDGYCIANIDPLNYGGKPLNEVVFWRGSGIGAVSEVEIPALEVRLGRMATHKSA